MSVVWPALAGLVFITFPTLRHIAVESWATEQGSHSPLVLASGLWLLVSLQLEFRPLQKRPPAVWAFAAIIATAAALLVFRTAAVIELEVYALYGLFVAVLYAFIGWRALKSLWFPPALPGVCRTFARQPDCRCH
jgi:hypothetical protein